MRDLKHPFKKEMEELRTLIKTADKGIAERFKWKAPSYHLAEQDFLTFNPRDLKRIHLIFHHPLIEQLKSPLLEGDLKGRRMTYIDSAEDLSKKKKAFQKIIKDLLALIKASI
jgi:hypothetical protein